MKPDDMPMEEWLQLLRARARQLAQPELDQFAAEWFERHHADPTTFLRWLEDEARTVAAEAG
jgi:hypothetical protein